MSNEYKNIKENGESDNNPWVENSGNHKMALNRNILLIICLIIISAALAGVLLMLIMCLKRRPSMATRKADIPESLSRKTMVTNPNSCSIYFDSNKKPVFGTMKSNSNHNSNMSLNYRMVNADKYQDLMADPSQGSYAGLAVKPFLCIFNSMSR